MGCNVAFVVGMFAGVDTNVCVDLKSVGKVMILNVRGLFDIETVVIAVNSFGTAVEECFVVLSRVLSDVGGEVKTFVVCVLGCGKDVGVTVENDDAGAVVKEEFNVNVVWAFMVGWLDVVGFPVGVVAFVVSTVAPGGVDGVVAFVDCALDCIENVGVSVDRIYVDVENDDALAF